MNAETLFKYLRRNIKNGVIDFAIRAQEDPVGTVKFYIHPANESGDTLDFLLWEEPDSGFDLLANEREVPPTDSAKLLALIHKKG